MLDKIFSSGKNKAIAGAIVAGIIAVLGWIAQSSGNPLATKALEKANENRGTMETMIENKLNEADAKKENAKPE